MLVVAGGGGVDFGERDVASRLVTVRAEIGWRRSVELKRSFAMYNGVTVAAEVGERVRRVVVELRSRELQVTALRRP